MTRTRPAVLNFARHYLEMVLAMLAGMFVLGMPLESLLSDGGRWHTELELLVMAVTMTVPMVAWMRYRGHAWQLAWEMSAAMFVPTFVAIGLLWAGLVEDAHTLLMIQHTAMFPLMFVAMLLRRGEYTGHASA